MTDLPDQGTAADDHARFRMSRRSVLGGCVSLAVMASVAATRGMAAPQDFDLKVKTAQGILEGKREGSISVWRGIRYAAPPVGDNRWRAPQPPERFEGVRQATTFGPACLQKVARNEPERSLKDKPQSEDCLTLNIWAPDGARPGSLPVMVWIHGGSFRFGTGALDLYHGQDLASRGAIVVTINYRLGLFGTFSHPALRKDGNEDIDFGLLDQIAALKWVKENIAGFGGDPENITLFGQSAGAVSVSYLMASPMAKGLFQKAIVESGGLAVPLHDRAEGDRIGLGVARKLKLPDDVDAETLRKLPPADLVNVDYSAADVMPMQDNRVIHRSLPAAFAAGDSGDIPIIIGWTTAEAGFFGPGYWKGLPDQLEQARWTTLKSLTYGYGKESDDAAAEQIASEWFAGSVSRQMVQLHGGPVHSYRFGWVPPKERATARGAIHTAEIPYVFGHVARDSQADSGSRKLSQELADRWVAFAKTGSPQAGGALNWAQTDDDLDNMLLITNDGEKLGTDPAASLDEAITKMKLPPRP